MTIKVSVDLPAMTTGIIDFMMRSGFMTAIAEIPTPDLAVPYAAPRADKGVCYNHDFHVSLLQGFESNFLRTVRKRELRVQFQMRCKL